MIKNLKKTDLGLEGIIPFKLFNKDIKIFMFFEDPEKELKIVEYAEKCAEALNVLSAETIDRLCKYSDRYRKDFCSCVGEDCPKLSRTKDILKYIDPLSLCVIEPQDNDIVLHLELNCAWEEEHGMQWLMKAGKILYVGPYDDISAYEEESYYKECENYIF